MKHYDRLNLSYRRIIEITFGLDFILLGNIAFGATIISKGATSGRSWYAWEFMIVSVVLKEWPASIFLLVQRNEERQAELIDP